MSEPDSREARRLSVLQSTDLLDTDAEAPFDRLTRLSSRLLGAPVALISLVDDHRQFFKSAVGLAEPWASRRETPLSHSFCQHVVRNAEPLVVSDARRHPLLRDNPAIRDLNVVAYAGVPLTVDGEAIGAFCVIDDKPRDWPAGELELLHDLAAAAVSEVQLRRALGRARKLEDSLRQSEQIHRAIVQHLPLGAVFMMDADMRYVSADGPLLASLMQQGDVKELVGKRVPEIASEANRDRLLAFYGKALAGERQDMELAYGDRWYELSAVPIFDRETVTHAVVVLYDVTPRKQEAESLRRARDEVARERGLLEAALANIEDGMVLLDHQRRILLANASFAAMFSLHQETLTGMSRETFVEWVAPVAEDPEAFTRIMLSADRGEPQEFVFLRPRRRVLKRSLTSVRLGDGEGYLVTWHDVTAERDLLRERERLLLVDALTGIPNRRALETALHIEAERMKRTGTPFCVALLDVDHFKRVNDVHGHGAGDDVLRAVGGTLSSQVRVTDTAGRWGGEEFLAVLNGALPGAHVFGERTRAAIEKLRCPPVERITISIGLAEVMPGESVLDAVARADKRLYEAKAGGRNRVCS